MILSFIPLFIYGVIFFFRFSHSLEYGLFLAGLSMGYFFIIIDHLLYFYYAVDSIPFVQHGRSLFKQKRYIALLRFALKNRNSMTRMITRSVLFVGVYIPLSFYIITSSQSTIGLGLVLGLGLRMVWDMIRFYRYTDYFQEIFLWQITRSLSAKEIRILVAIFVGIFLTFTIFALRG